MVNKFWKIEAYNKGNKTVMWCYKVPGKEKVTDNIVIVLIERFS